MMAHLVVFGGVVFVVSLLIRIARVLGANNPR
jgi:hypothetical protein